MGSIVGASHLSWVNDGSELGAAGPVQYAVGPWFELATLAGGVGLTMHAGRASWAGEFNLSNGVLSFVANAQSSNAYIAMTASSQTVLISKELFDDLALDSDTAQTSKTYYSNQTGLAADAGQILVTTIGASVFAIVSMPNRSGLSVFTYVSGNQAQYQTAMADTLLTNLSKPVGMASITHGSATFVFAVSSNETGLSAYSLGPSGSLGSIGNLTANDGLWVSNITKLVATTVGGDAYLLVGAAGSNSLSVVQVATNGQMTVVDHVLDDLNTRFNDITILEVLVVADRTYVAVSGGDNGLSLYALLPGGHLLHLQTVEDTQALGLDSISAISLVFQTGRLHIIASSETEAGLTHIVYDPGLGQQIAGGAGNDTLVGTAYDDILLDGGGVDSLTGGAGADLFVLSADGVQDTITDFQIGVDLIDLSAWSGLYSTLQIEVTALAFGAEIRFGTETLILQPTSGGSITMADLLATNILGIARIDPNSVAPPPLTADFFGTADADSLVGNPLNNVIFGREGDDSIRGAEANDTLWGEGGRDTLYGDAGDDVLNGGESHDLLYGGNGHDTLIGDTGADTLYGGSGNDALWGDSSTDVLYGDAGNDTLTGGVGADTLYGGDGNDSLLSNTGVDEVHGGTGNDWISPGDGADAAYGDAGNDTIIGRTGWDTLYGGSGDDELYGSEGRDLLFGDDGNDYLSGGYGFDTLYGGTGDDVLYGNIGEDRLFGGDGKDTLYGATGEDYLAGGTGDDILYGAQGRDTLIGGAGNDLLRGGTLGDTFIFERGHDQDTVSGLDWLDQLHLSTGLTGGLTDAAAIVAAFETRIYGQVALSFGDGDVIIFDTEVTSADLIDLIYTF